MPNKGHHKPSPDEIDAEIAKAQAYLDSLDKKEEVVEVPTEIPAAEVAVEEPIVETPAEEPAAEERVDEIKKKFVASAREAQVLQARTKKFDDAVVTASEIEAPTDEEMSKEYPEWDIMDDFAKKLAKDSTVNKKRFELIHQASMEGRDLQEWYGKVDTFLSDPKTLVDSPDLEGKQDDFKVFATKPTRRGLDFEDLVKAFLYDASKTVKSTVRGKMFETGSGGPNDRPKPKGEKMGVLEGRNLMKNDYNKWKQLLKDGKIFNE